MILTQAHDSEATRTSSPEGSDGPNVAAEAPTIIELTFGLPLNQLDRRLRVADRRTDVGHRETAFYLTDMDARGVHQLLGYSSTVQYAVQRLQMSRRSAHEMLAAGRALLDLPKIDAAFCEGLLRWARVRLILRVVRPPVEAEWLEAALALDWKALERKVLTTEPGRAPRADSHGLPALQLTVKARLDPVSYEKFEQARRKLGEERGAPVSEAEFLKVMTDAVLSGTAPSNAVPQGPSPLCHVTVNRCPDCHDASVHSEDGPTPVDAPTAETLACDAAAGGTHQDVPTPPALRAKVLARDGHRCRACSSPLSLQAHHIRWRSEGGATNAQNLVAMCARCHSLVHERRTVVEGTAPHDIRFLDAERRPLNGRIPCDDLVVRVVPSASTPTTEQTAGTAATAEVGPPLADLPPEVDAAWFARHAASFRWNDRHGEMQYEAGVATEPARTEPERTVPEDAHNGKSACAQRRTSPTPPAEGGPSALDEFVGQRETKRLLHTAVLAANRRGAALDHALLFGPPGVGKSTVARLLAIDLGVRAKVVNAPTLSEPGVLLRLLTGLRARDVLFIDEIHALPQRLVETLYEAMEERRASFAVGDGRRSRTLSVKLEPFTLVGATTEAGRLPAPFESRFGLQAFFAPYELDDLGEILSRAATREGLRLEHDAAATLADAARGSARTALALFRRARDCAQLRAPGAESPRIDQGAAEAALAALTIDARGLKAVERRALDALVGRGGGQTVGLARWAVLAGIDAATLRRTCEPALLDAGLIRIGPRGRTPTAAAYSGSTGVRDATRSA